MGQPGQAARGNRLAGESSPYLLQHAHNPVHWQPWGAEAFEEARRRRVPVFLSIGYATCYWCHVMERESFESDSIARLMNERFVCVKVDREERPDVDEIYMAATQIMTGHGGWPMSVFLEPESLRPFWCGTYFPPEPARGLPGFPQVIDGISRAWAEQRADVLEQARTLAQAVREHLSGTRAAVPVGSAQVTGAVSALLTMHDRVRGGFASAPKFPQPVYLDLLLEFLPHAGDGASAAAVEQAIRLTLDRMALGGVFDQIGGGFHRYSVDGEWTVPHFEKMLYDNAMLASVYARASRRFADPFYARVAGRTAGYVLREMTSPDGAFYSAQDAEVDGREGLNYLWTPDEVRAALPDDDAGFAMRVYGLDRGPNFRDPHHPDAPAASVLRLEDRPERVAASMGLQPGAFVERLDRVNARLYEARLRRKQPRLDDKVLCAWNGLMIGGLASCAAALEEPVFRRAAERGADFLLSTLRTGDELRRSWRAGVSKVPGFLEDYACSVHGLAALHRAGGDAFGPYLTAARELADAAERRFGDRQGGFYDTLEDQSDLFVRARATYDGAIPCGASVMLNALTDLHEIQGGESAARAAAACLASLSAAVAASPVGSANSTRGLLRLMLGAPAALDAALPAGVTPASPASDGRSPVAVLASSDRISVSRADPATLDLRLRIAEGYHVAAAQQDPQGPELTPLRVGLAGGAGLEVYADYPAGEELDGPLGRVRVHRGEIILPVVLERAGEWKGKPVLTVSFQACTESECLLPATVELDVAIDRAD